ncbi:carbohydrate ABC transporter permease [Paenibacillus eucommiae]|uniref:Raffinose/stachyose/melibiose transport system permease protein n=1 Tax=Paenibacillus eucommiae TaxID=1355755 RepID=A0ABS4JAF3_9BACL|nr:carbohydrate ABC transporter permease [Paenibacillus eucommiae]MBP1996834.1 raffinose/stachyose/melibiose transport system permease protein [Paenibacillus eucommiae]
MIQERRLWIRWMQYLTLSFFTIVYFYPLIMLLSFSVKKNEDMYSNPFGFVGPMRFENYAEAWNISNYHVALLNSTYITIISVIVIILIGSMASYPLARRQGKISAFLQGLFVAGLIVPMQLNIIPLFKLINSLGLNKSPLGVIFMYIAFGMPITVFLITQFIRSLPRELEEAARMDGCSGMGVFLRILSPLLKPILATVFILQFLSIWNDFFLPIVFLNSDKLKTVQVAVYSFVGRYTNDWSHMFPMMVLSIAPVLLLYISFQKYIISGIMSGAVKG